MRPRRPLPVVGGRRQPCREAGGRAGRKAGWRQVQTRLCPRRTACFAPSSLKPRLRPRARLACLTGDAVLQPAAQEQQAGGSAQCSLAHVCPSYRAGLACASRSTRFMVLVVMRRRCSSEAAVAASSTRFTRCPVLAEMNTMLAHSMGRSCRYVCVCVCGVVGGGLGWGGVGWGGTRWALALRQARNRLPLAVDDALARLPLARLPLAPRPGGLPHAARRPLSDAHLRAHVRLVVCQRLVGLDGHRVPLVDRDDAGAPLGSLHARAAGGWAAGWVHALLPDMLAHQLGWQVRASKSTASHTL